MDNEEQEKQQEQQGPRKTAVDHVNDFVKWTKRTQRLKTLASAGHAAAGLYGGTSTAGAAGASGAAAAGGAGAVGTAGAAAGGAAAAGGTTAVGVTAPGWLPFAIAGAILAIIILIFILLLKPPIPGLGGRSSSQPGGPGGTGGGGGIISPGAIISCPIAGGTVSAPSYQADPTNGHCSTSYVNAGYSCDPNSRRAKSIDVTTGGPNGSDVLLPTIKGQIVQWIYITAFTISPNDCEEKASDGGCGAGLVFQANSGSDTWTLHLLHMGAVNVQIGSSYPSGSPVGKTAIGHVHISIGNNVPGDPALVPVGSWDTRSGWIPADKEVGMCTKIIPQTSEFISPNYNTCGGAYNLSLNPAGQNFGDPSCEIATEADRLDRLYTLLKQHDPSYTDIWYFIIIPKESSYNPNAFLGSSSSGKGAYGMFQMNPTGQGNGQYDAGNVVWGQQVYNAVTYNNSLIQIGKAFDYWASRPCRYVDASDADYPAPHCSP